MRRNGGSGCPYGFGAAAKAPCLQGAGEGLRTIHNKSMRAGRLLVDDLFALTSHRTTPLPVSILQCKRVRAAGTPTAALVVSGPVQAQVAL